MPLAYQEFCGQGSEFLFVPADRVMQVAKEQNATPFDVSNVELGHHGDECSFDAIMKKYDLDKKDPALIELAKIVRGADTSNRSLTPQSEGLLAIAYGFSMNAKDDHDNIGKQFHVYDALHSFCKWKITSKK